VFHEINLDNALLPFRLGRLPWPYLLADISHDTLPCLGSGQLILLGNILTISGLGRC
jgi:hypothetical protein